MFGDAFVEHFADTNLGPLVKIAAADFVRGQIEEAVGQGAKPLADPSTASNPRPVTAAELARCFRAAVKGDL